LQTLTNFNETRILSASISLFTNNREEPQRMDIAMTSLADGTLDKALLWRLAADPHHA